MSKLDILGSVNLDIVLRLHDLPRPGETVHATQSERYLGGKGANQAVSAARTGADLRFRACVGNDEDGEWLTAQLAAHAVTPADVEV
ncbi:MAG TPA: ribokinase, partial [Hyphomonas sp.]|nr:ribokinase [Hyphomonas sp.]